MIQACVTGKQMRLAEAQSLQTGLQMLGKAGIVRRQMLHQRNTERRWFSGIDQDPAFCAEKLGVQPGTGVIQMHNFTHTVFIIILEKKRRHGIPRILFDNRITHSQNKYHNYNINTNKGDGECIYWKRMRNCFYRRY